MPESDFLDCMRMAGEMERIRETAKTIHGDHYHALASQYSDILCAAMRQFGTESPITALLRIEHDAADKLSEGDMLLLISAAADLIAPRKDALRKAVCKLSG